MIEDWEIGMLNFKADGDEHEALAKIGKIFCRVSGKKPLFFPWHYYKAPSCGPNLQMSFNFKT